MSSETPVTSELGPPWDTVLRTYPTKLNEATELAQLALQRLQENPGLIDALSFLSIILSPRNPLISSGEYEVVLSSSTTESVYSIKARTLYTYFVSNTLTMGIINPAEQVDIIDLKEITSIKFVECRIP